MLPRLSYPFGDIEKHDQIHVGTLGVSIGELSRTGVVIPDGYVLSAACYFLFLKENNLTTKINHLLGTVHFSDTHSLLQVASHIRKLIKESEMSDDLAGEILSVHKTLGSHETPVMLTASPTSELGTSLSFLGHHEEILSVGDTSLLTGIKDIWAGLFEARSIYYRHEKRIDHFKTGMAVVIKKFIPCDASGKYFSANPLNHDKKTMVIEARYGLNFPDSEQQPLDHYLINKTSGTIEQSFIAEQRLERERVGNEIHTTRVSEEKATKPKLSPSQIAELVKTAKLLEEHYYFPVECSWISHNNSIHILSCKPLTLHPLNETPQTYFPDASKIGVPITQGIASGHIRIIRDDKDTKKILPGEIIVLRSLPDVLPPEFKKAYGIITEQAAYDQKMIVHLKSQSKPVIGGITGATTSLKNASVWTINGATGALTPGGLLRTAFHKRAQQMMRKVATKAFMILESDRDISQLSLYQSDGVGLFDGNSLIKSLSIHPKKVLSEKQATEYVEKIKASLHTICVDFNPRPVLYRLSNLTSTEYRSLTGGKTHEPQEENPFLGYRGGIRYIHDKKSIQTELKAVHTLRENGMTNLQIILPGIRTVQELQLIIEQLKKTGLTASRSFKLWLSIDTPAQAILIDSFLKEAIDGILLNPDSLGALFIGADPQNSEVTSLVQEDSDALMHAYQYCIKRATKYEKPSLISLRTSDHADHVIEKLVSWGVSGIVVKPDSIENLCKTIYKYERKLVT